MKVLQISTSSQTDFLNITPQVEKYILEEGRDSGSLHIFVPHTTAGITINEGADPSVQKDMGEVLTSLIPWKGPYLHREGNTAAHVKASLMGASLQLMIEGGGLVLGTWQSIFFCEFDGPRQRKVFIRATA